MSRPLLMSFSGNGGLDSFPSPMTKGRKLAERAPRRSLHSASFRDLESDPVTRTPRRMTGRRMLRTATKAPTAHPFAIASRSLT
jgi:hypothetical protein